MTKHKLAVLENAFDSLNEGLRKYRAGKSGEVGAYKFAVQHIAHFMELYFKAQVAKRHPLLLYKAPFAKDYRKRGTISLWEAMQFLENDGVVFNLSLKPDLEWFKELRNSIEHAAFELEPKDVRRAIGRLVRATEDFAAAHKLRTIRDAVSPDNTDAYDVLASEYDHDLEEAKQSIVDEGETPYQCRICMLADVALDTGEGMECRFCGEIDKFQTCGLCGSIEVQSEMSVWNEDVDPIVYICDECHARVMSLMGID